MERKCAVTRLLSMPNREVGIGASAVEIDRAEEHLGVTFSQSYRLFLEEVGWGGVAHIELYGLGDDVPPFLHLIEITMTERLQASPPLPNYLIPLMNDGMGNHFCLDAHSMEENESPVVFWNHERGDDQEPEPVADDFDTWLSDVLDSIESDA